MIDSSRASCRDRYNLGEVGRRGWTFRPVEGDMINDTKPEIFERLRLMHYWFNLQLVRQSLAREHDERKHSETSCVFAEVMGTFLQFSRIKLVSFIIFHRT